MVIHIQSTTSTVLTFFILLIVLTLCFAQNLDPLLGNVLPTTVDSQSPLLINHGCFRYLDQYGFYGCTSRSRQGDLGRIIHLNTSTDLELYFLLMDSYYEANFGSKMLFGNNNNDDYDLINHNKQHTPVKESKTPFDTIGAKHPEFILLLPSHLMTTDVLSRLNTTTTLLNNNNNNNNLNNNKKKPLFDHTDYFVSGIISYYTPLQNNQDPTAFNYESQIPNQNLALSINSTHYNYVWNPSGTDLTHKSLLFPITLLKDLRLTFNQQEQYDDVRNAKYDKGTLQWNDDLSIERNHLQYLKIYGTSNWNALINIAKKVKQQQDNNANNEDIAKLLKRDQFYQHLIHNLPYFGALSFYNSARLNAKSCLKSRTCAPMGGHNVVGVLSTPNYIPQHPYILVPYQYNTKSLFYDVTYGTSDVISSLIPNLIASLVLTKHYNASIIQNTTSAVYPTWWDQIEQHGESYQTPKRIVFVGFAGESYSHLGSRALLDDLWKSLEFRINNNTNNNDNNNNQTKKSSFSLKDDPTPPPITITQFPCNRTRPGVTRPPLNELGLSSQISCDRPFRVSTYPFNGLDLRDLDSIIEFNAPLGDGQDTLFLHTEYKGKWYNNKKQHDYTSIYKQIIEKVEILKKTGMIDIKEAGYLNNDTSTSNTGAGDDRVTPGIPLASITSTFAHNLTYLSEDLVEKYNFTYFNNNNNNNNNNNWLAPTSIFITNYNTTIQDIGVNNSRNNNNNNNNNYKYSIYDDQNILKNKDDYGHNLLCGHITAYTRFLYFISHRDLWSNPQDTDRSDGDNNLLNYVTQNITVSCPLVNDMINCLTNNIQTRYDDNNINTNDGDVDINDNICTIFKDISKLFIEQQPEPLRPAEQQYEDEIETENNKENEQQLKQQQQNKKKDPYFRPRKISNFATDVYFPKYISDITSKWARFLYNWYDFVGFYASFNSNRDYFNENSLNNNTNIIINNTDIKQHDDIKQFEVLQQQQQQQNEEKLKNGNFYPYFSSSALFDDHLQNEESYHHQQQHNDNNYKTNQSQMKQISFQQRIISSFKKIIDINNKSIAAQFVQKTILLANKITGIDIITWLTPSKAASSIENAQESEFSTMKTSDFKALSHDLGIDENIINNQLLEEFNQQHQRPLPKLLKYSPHKRKNTIININSNNSLLNNNNVILSAEEKQKLQDINASLVTLGNNNTGIDGGGDDDDDSAEIDNYITLLNFLSKHRFSHYHDALDPYLELDIDNNQFVFTKQYYDIEKYNLNNITLMGEQKLLPFVYVESNWDNHTKIQYFQQVTPKWAWLSAMVAIIIVGVALLSMLAWSNSYSAHYWPQQKYTSNH